MAHLRAEPKLALRAVDEGMRWAPLPWALPHTATRDHTYKGINFATGDLAFVLVPAANRDASVVPNPHDFDITRDRARNFAFGHGMHGCPGAQLARMEMAAALRGLIETFPHIALADAPVWEPGNKDRTLETLSITVGR